MNEHVLSEIERGENWLMADDLPIAMLRFEDNKCVYANESWSRFTGRPTESAIGDGYLDAIHPADHSRFLELREEFPNGIPEETVVINDIEGSNINPDGSITWFLSQCCMRYSHEGKLISKTITFIDNTHRKQRAQQQEKLSAILEATTDFICTASTDYKMTWRNQRLAELRADLDPQRGANCMDKYPPSSRKLVEEIAVPAAIADGSWSGEVDILDSEGNIVPVSYLLIAHKREDGSVESFSTVMRGIGDLTSTRLALQASQQKYASLVAASPVAIFQKDATGNCVYVNERWGEMTQRPTESAMGVGYQEAVCPEDLPAISKVFEAFIEDTNQLVTEPVEGRHLLPDGGFNWFQAQFAKLFDEDGGISGYIGSLTDISNIKEAEEKIRAIGDRLELVLKSASVGTFEFCPSENSLIWSDQTMEMFGISPAEFGGVGDDFFKRIHPDDQDRMQAKYDELLKMGHDKVQFRIVRPDGKIRHLFANRTVQHDEPNGSKKLIGVVIDVTELRTTQIELEETQTHLQVMSDNIPSMLFRYTRNADGSHEFPFVSSGSRSLFGVESKDAIENPELIFEKIHWEDVQQLEELTEESARTLKTFQYDYRVVLEDGQQRWIQAISEPTRKDDGAVVWDGLAIDITQRKHADLQLRKAKMKDEFLANVSHELRTPLNAMLGMTEGLQKGIFGPLTQKQLDSLQVVEQSGAHLLELINELLDLGQVESGQMVLTMSAIEVKELCESSLQFVTQQANKKNIQLNLDVPWNVPKIQLDEKRIRQVLINLLDNAVKFTPDGGRVTIQVERLPGTEGAAEEVLRIAVSDTGIGIDSDQLDSLFVPFVQVDSSLSRNYEGTGLGLALVKQYVELHEGHVAVKSELGSGSCFEFTVPYRQSSEDAPPETQRAVDPPVKFPVVDPPSGSDSLPLVLLAEDNHDIALATCSFLNATGFQVLHATDGAMAIELAVEHSPALILMDIQMPGVDGLETIERLREISEHKETPIIAVTGLARKFDSKRCLDAGATEYLCKPYRMEDLVNTMRDLLKLPTAA